MSLVTIRGQLGTGAPEIGRLVAEQLQADYVDREIIAQVAARLQRKEQDVIAKETPPSGLPRSSRSPAPSACIRAGRSSTLSSRRGTSATCIFSASR